MASTPYRPPIKGSVLEIPLLALVMRADPEWGRYRTREVEYEFTRRIFWANPLTRGAYNDNEN